MHAQITISLATVLAGLKWYAVGVVAVVLLSNVADDIRAVITRRKP